MIGGNTFEYLRHTFSPLWVALPCCAILIAPTAAHGFGYALSDDYGEDLVKHPQGYLGIGKTLNITVGIDPTSANAASMQIPVRNVVIVWNNLLSTTTNLAIGAGNGIAWDEIDFESVLLHEFGHALALNHPNLSYESGLSGDDRNYTKALTGANTAYDLDAGGDAIRGSGDDSRGDDVNLNWFRKSNNNPFTLAIPVDASTYSHSSGDLPGGHGFSANGDRDVAAALGHADTECVMQQGTFYDEAQRTLSHDDVAGIRFGMCGLDETESTADDYDISLIYVGLDSSADVLIDFDNSKTTFARTFTTNYFLSDGNHWRTSYAGIFFSTNYPWHFNAPTLLQGVLSVSPGIPYKPSGKRGGPFYPSSVVHTLTNSGTDSLSWSVGHTQNWITVSATSGILDADEFTNITASVNTNANLLSQGAHIDLIVFTNLTTGGTRKCRVELSMPENASLPFSETWESGAMADCWTVTGLEDYRTRVTTLGAPYAGSYHMVMDDSVSGDSFSLNEVTLCVDLKNYTNVDLTFWAKEYGDEDNGPPSIPFAGREIVDSVVISDDGVLWYEVQGLRSETSAAYLEFSIDLDTEIAKYGLTYNPFFRVRFCQYDNTGITADGIAVDDISITGTYVPDFDDDGIPDSSDPDDDNDGMPDAYELQYGLNPTNAADATLDPDGDGVINLSEYVADTIPTNASSLFELGIEAGTNEGVQVISFPSSTARLYHLLLKTNLLLGNWLPTSTNVPGEGGTQSIEGTNAVSPGFYRLNVEVP